MTTNALLEQEIPQCLPIIETLCSAGWEVDTYLMPRISSTPDADRLALSLQVHRDRQRRSVNYYLDTSGVPLSSRSEGRRDGPGQLYLLCRLNAKKKITWYTVTLTLAAAKSMLEAVETVHAPGQLPREGTLSYYRYIRSDARESTLEELEAGSSPHIEKVHNAAKAERP